MTQPTAESTTTPGEVTAVWAEARVTDLLATYAADVTPPEYGSALWLRLKTGDPLKSAAVIVAAERWRRQEAEQARLEALYHEDPEGWFREVTADADRYASRLGRALASTPKWEETRKRRQHRKPWPVTAVPGRAVAIPGRPGWWRHCIDGRQTDLPYRDIDQAERRDAA
jgi:hypothetical protein